jgi:methylthioribulose-1-phosphate dehydratase
MSRINDPEFDTRAAELIAAGQRLYALGMVPATSGNFSARLAGAEFAITVSGAHKGQLDRSHIMRIGAGGDPLDGNRPSAETALHLQIYRRFPDANIVLHPHSVHATALSRLRGNTVLLSDYELLKAFPGIDTHDCTLAVPNFANDQDIDRLARTVEVWMDAHEGALHGYLITGHGFYTWGNSMTDALRHVEAFEFLFECELRLREVTRE